MSIEHVASVRTRRSARARCARWLSAGAAALLALCGWSVGLLQASGAALSTTASPLKPGEFRWTPQLAPHGPMLIVVGLSEQLAYVYRNGVRIGMSTISSGRRGYETPTGVFSILQKHREHFSNLYDDAPMPFMQRLSWSGLALHAGKLPGHPASHGCIRLPYAFSERLFEATTTGMTVIVTDSIASEPAPAAPALFAPATGAAATPSGPAGESAAADAETLWAPERAPAGPLNVVLSTSDGYASVLRNGVEIGHAQVRVRGPAPIGTRAYMVLEGQGPEPSPVAPDRPSLRWLAVPVPGAGTGGVGELQAMVAGGGLEVPPDFAQRVHDALVPGSILVVTDEPIRADRDTATVTILRADSPKPARLVPPGH